MHFMKWADNTEEICKTNKKLPDQEAFYLSGY